MRVLHVVHHLGMGGAQRLISDILPVMREQVEVTVLVTHRVKSEFARKLTDSGIDIISLDIKNIHHPLIPFRIARVARHYDVIHVHLFPSLYMVALACLFMRVPIVYTEHSTYNQRRTKWYLRPIEQLVYKRYNRIISISEHTQTQLMKWIRPARGDKRFVVVHNGVVLSSFQCERKPKARPDTLIMVSRFAPSKDHATLIRAMRLLPHDVRLILVGSGETLQQCKALAHELQVDDRIEFAGKQFNIASWIAKADIGVQASVWEGFGLTAVELMAGGLPVVASSVDGLKQVVEGAGEIYASGDEKALATVIRRLIDEPEFYAAVRDRCAERAHQYDIRTMVRKYIDVYKSLSNS